METPSSMRRFTRSQTQREGTLKSQPQSKSRQKDDRFALIDITNDSPIVGLAAGVMKTPLPNTGWRTPGSGEALLRCQVKTLLQKVEEDEVQVVKDPLIGIFNHLRSPASLLAPTPANTPQIELPLAALGVDKKEESPDLSACEINRALLFNSPEDSDSSFPLSELTSEESVCRESSEDDSSSVWSLQVHDGSSQKNDEEEEEDIDDEDDDLQESLSDDKDDSSFPISEPSLQESVCREATEDDSSSFWSLQVHDGSSVKNDEDDENDDLRELCEGIRRMSVGKSELPEFAGKHVRFKYDSDDEIVGKEEVTAVVSPSVIRLNGLPVPEGKHLRFQEEEED